MLSPSKYKWRKVQRGRIRGATKGGAALESGEFGLTATTCGYVNSREIEAARICINRYLRREGNLWIRIFPHKPVTKRPAETRMGKGKGDVDHYVAVVKPGRVIFEVGGVKRETALNVLKKASYKLSVQTKILEHPPF
ncbi:50S ribosomal protein L16 [Spirochaetota bacterium]|nr:50S ribosomal protein L16 [Spirochaetota bacterium]